MVYINDQYRFIFIENPKSGSTAIIIALNTILNNIISREFNVNDAHKTSEQVRSEIGLERWNSYFKFTTFRDPLERFCSSMNFIYHKKIIDKNYQLRSYIDLKLVEDHYRSSKNECCYCRNQEDYTDGMDFIIRLSNIQQDFDEVCDLLGLPKTVIGNYNNCNIVNRLDPVRLKTIFETGLIALNKHTNGHIG